MRNNLTQEHIIQVVNAMIRKSDDSEFDDGWNTALWALLDSLGFDDDYPELEMLCGQEWYDRFKTEFVKEMSVSYNGNLLEVAKRASGL